MKKQENKDWSGERLETYVTNGAMLEHLHRYSILASIVKEKTVLDIACGEGYGSAMLSKNASHVTGIDIDAETIQKASHKYNKGNITFKTGSLENIECADNSIDIIVCFESIEHIEEHDKVFSEFKRVLKPDGILIISTPDKLNYSEKINYTNPFHKKEMYESEFKAIINKHFTSASFYKQNSLVGSVILSDANMLEEFHTGSYSKIDSTNTITPVYWIAIASDAVIPALPTGIFKHEKSIAELLVEEAEAVRRTITYRTGNLLLSPFKFIKSFFKN